MYLSQEFNNNILNLVKQKGFYLYEFMINFENLKKNYLEKTGFIVL